MPPYAKRIETARVRAGKSLAEMAALLSLTFESYRDLESFDDEVLTCVSLQQVEQLCEALDLSSVDLLTAPHAGADHHVTLQELLDRVRRYIQEHHLSVEEFEAQAGWEIKPALGNAERVLEWNIACLQDVCAQVGVNWRAVFPLRTCV